MLGGPSLICRGMMVLPALPVPPCSFCPTRCDQLITTFRTAELCVVSGEEQQQQRAGQSSRLGAAGSTGRRAPCLPLHQAARLHPHVSGKLLRTAGPAAWYLHRSQQGCSDPQGCSAQEMLLLTRGQILPIPLRRDRSALTAS